MGWVRGDSPSPVMAMRSGSSELPTTVSLPAGRTISALRSWTTRLEPSGAALPTISMTLKYWLRKPISPGITTTPGMGGTTNCCPAKVSGLRLKPWTLRLGIWVWASLSVSGMMVERLGSWGWESPATPTCRSVTSSAEASVGKRTGKSIWIFFPSATAKAAVKL